MHNQDDKHQSKNEEQEIAFEEPSWVKPVKVASAIMGLMIVAGLVLLVYGVSTGMGKLAETTKGDRVFTYPAGHSLVTSSSSPDGNVQLVFDDANGTRKILTIDPNSKKVIATITLQEGKAFGFND